MMTRFARPNHPISSAFLLVGLLSTVALSVSLVPTRFESNINDSETFVLKGNTRPVVTSGLAQDQGPVPGSQAMPPMSLHFKLTAAQEADRDQLLAAQQNTPLSPVPQISNSGTIRGPLRPKQRRH